LLEQQPREDRLLQLGGLMFASHYGYSMCGLDSPATNHLVELVRAAVPRSGLYGARITGGGGGGTIAVVGRADARRAVARIARTYTEWTGRPARIFSGSSAGAMDFGVRRVPS
jgi:L-arabinokinase